MLDTDDYKAITQQIIEEETHGYGNVPKVQMPFRKSETHVYSGHVQPKQRPRISNGKAFTPKETRQFEAKVKKWAQSCNMSICTYPVEVTITMMERTTDEEKIFHSKMGLVYPMRGDIDNLAKGILDALNGIAYVDDKQIINLSLMWEYSKSAGFEITLKRAGLSRFEYDNLLKYIKRARQNG